MSVKKWRPVETRKSNVLTQCPNCKRVRQADSCYAISENGKETVFFDKCPVCGLTNEVSFYKVKSIKRVDTVDDLLEDFPE